MQGTIIVFDADSCAGVIKGEDGQAYYFTVQHWLYSAIRPIENMIVFFTPEPVEGYASCIIPAPQHHEAKAG